MAGLIREQSIQEVREKARIEDVVSQYVTLRRAGAGSMKGLCPFHDEKTPSFNVNTSRGFFHCLAGETRVLTDQGPREIRELVGGVHKVLGRGGHWVEAPFKAYGVQRLHRITVTRNRQSKELYATDGHRWFVRAGKDHGVECEVVTTALKAGDRLVAKFPRSGIQPTTPSPFGIAHGSTYGDVAADKKFARRGWVVQSVEETDRVEEVYCAEVEDGHAFTLEDNILTGNCFGCGEGGDVIAFVMKIDGLAFAEAVERLADKVGVVLTREEGDDRPQRRGPSRGKLIEAHKLAQEFYAEQLVGPDALVARQFLAERDFDREAAEHFGVGFSPRGGEALVRHLRGRGFTVDELVAGGLAAHSSRVGGSAYDKFRGRLMWPIREPGGDVIGFGARRLFDDDRVEAKYLNTAETPLYRKSQVLYGIDLARKEMARTGQAVIVEGYTDVMACHLAGVGTAVATCGTAFGDDHAKVLRRFIADRDQLRGEVVFTFDGDAAGQAAALKAFQGDQNFVSQTYVAVESDGLDPCDLRIKKGDEAIRELVSGRQPLYSFVLRNIVSKYDLARADSRVDAVREAAGLVASVRDQAKVTAFAQEISRLIGADVDTNAVVAEVRRARNRPPSASGRAPQRGQRPASGTTEAAPPGASPRPMPHPREPRFGVERETLKLVLQHPVVLGRTTSEVSADDFTHPLYRAVWQLIADAGGPVAGAGDAGWAARLRDAAPDPRIAAMVAELAVDPLPTSREPDAAYVLQHVVRLLELTDLRRIAEVKSRLQRADLAADPEGYRAMFAELAALEQHRRSLRDRVVTD